MQNLAIFGAGKIGKETKKLVEEKYSNEYKLVCFVDNDPAKQGTTIEDTPVISAEKLLELYGRDINCVAIALSSYHVIATFLFQQKIIPIHIRPTGIYPVEMKPKKVALDASTLCQLNCKTCYMRKNNFGTMGKGYLKFSDFRNFIYNNKFIEDIELANSGEIFLNPDLISILKYASENNITLHANGGVNFNSVSDKIIEALVKYRFKSMFIAIDGASQETYSLYRINGNFNVVIQNIKKLNDYKEKYNSQFPELFWQYIIMEHNENDIIKAKTMAKELKMQIHFKLTWDPGYIPKNAEMLKKETGLKQLNREDLFKNTGKLYGFERCYQLWTSPQINWDGRLLGCCSVFTDDFGVNVFEIGLENAINSENYMYAQKMLIGQVGVPENAKNLPCANCGFYKTMMQAGIYLHTIY